MSTCMSESKGESQGESKANAEKARRGGRAERSSAINAGGAGGEKQTDLLTPDGVRENIQNNVLAGGEARGERAGGKKQTDLLTPDGVRENIQNNVLAGGGSQGELPPGERAGRPFYEGGREKQTDLLTPDGVRENTVRNGATIRPVRETRMVFRGLTKAAKKLRVSRAHLSYVLHGQRKPGRRLAEALARMGIKDLWDAGERAVLALAAAGCLWAAVCDVARW